ncbi:MAG: DNA translocase FtsK [Thermoanaerobacteraceae bacterium]|nr:DNA translocase FtsK [Thermoanaerobacteraceae bacterium]
MLFEITCFGLGALGLASTAVKLPENHVTKLQKVFENTGLVAKVNGTVHRPRVIKKCRTEYGLHLTIKLPAGLCMTDFLKRQEEIEDYLNCEVDMEMKKHLHMYLYTHELKGYYPFKMADLEGELPFVVGYSKEGRLTADLAEFPHLLVAGETYGGKSVFLHQLIAQLMPHNVKLFVIDRARVEFAYLQNHAWFEHTMSGSIKMLQYLENEMKKRMEIFVKAGVEKIQEYHKKGYNLPYYVLVIDEFSQLSPKLNKDEKKQRETAHSHLVNLLCLARKVGIHVVLATQRPDRDILPGQLKANIPATVCFKVRNEVNSRICLDNDKAYYLPRIKGHAIYQFDKDRRIQVMHLDVSKARKLLPETTKTKPQKPADKKPPKPKKEGDIPIISQ